MPNDFKLLVQGKLSGDRHFGYYFLVGYLSFIFLQIFQFLKDVHLVRGSFKQQLNFQLPQMIQNSCYRSLQEKILFHFVFSKEILSTQVRILICFQTLDQNDFLNYQRTLIVNPQHVKIRFRIYQISMILTVLL